MRLLSVAIVSVMLLSGCLQQGGNGDDLPSGTGDWTAEAEYGLAVAEGTLHERIQPGQERTWTVQAVNEGPSGDNMIEYNKACGGPFTVTLSGPDGTQRQPEEPMMDCMAYEAAELVGGETLPHQWSWDGRLWDGSSRSDAPSGTYTLRFTFEGFHAGNPDHDFASWGETTVQVSG